MRFTANQSESPDLVRAGRLAGSLAEIGRLEETTMILQPRVIFITGRRYRDLQPPLQHQHRPNTIKLIRQLRYFIVIAAHRQEERRDKS